MEEFDNSQESKVSVIIVVQNSNSTFEKTIKSVIEQTYINFEIIIVFDAVCSDVVGILSKFDDERIKHVIEVKEAFIKTGVSAATGDILFFIENNNYYHPEKLKRHIDFLNENPHIHVTYNSRLDIDSSNRVFSFLKIPFPVDLPDVYLDFPVTLSELVIKREYVIKLDLEREGYYFDREVPYLIAQLVVAGANFEGFQAVLNYRVYCKPSSNSLSREWCESAIGEFEKIFLSPYYFKKGLSFREKALATIYLHWAYYAFAHYQTLLGQEFLRKSIRLNRSILDVEAFELLLFLVQFCIKDVKCEMKLNQVFEQFPTELVWLNQYRNNVLAQCYLVQGLISYMWKRIEEGVSLLHKAEHMGVQTDKQFWYEFVDELNSYELIFGSSSIGELLNDLLKIPHNLRVYKGVRWAISLFYINRAFQKYDQGKQKLIRKDVYRAILLNPKFLMNRGVIAMLLNAH